MTYVAAGDRYDRMPYRRCGRSGLLLPAVSLGLWQNFGDDRPLETSRAIVRRAFDLGVTHFDLANNYGPPYGSAEENFGRLLRDGPPALPRRARSISTKAGYDMWPGPYGEWGSRKYLLASLDQSLRADGPRLRRHLLLAPLRPGDAARGDDGRARHAPCGRARRSTSASPPTRRRRRARRRAILRDLGTPLLIHQPSYSMLNRWIEDGLLDALGERGRRLHRLLAARAGDADRQVPGRHPRGLAREPQRLALARHAHGRGAGEDPRAERDRRGARPDARADGDRLDAARPARHLGAGRREQRRAARGRTSPRSSDLDFTTEELAEIDRTRPTAASTSGPRRARSSRAGSASPRSSTP